MIPKELQDECDDIQRRVDAMTDDEIKCIGTTRDNLIRDRQHFAGVRYYSNPHGTPVDAKEGWTQSGMEAPNE